MREAMHVWGLEAYRKILCLLVNFTLNLKLFQKSLSLKILLNKKKKKASLKRPILYDSIYMNYSAKANL